MGANCADKFHDNEAKVEFIHHSSSLVVRTYGLKNELIRNAEMHDHVSGGMIDFAATAVIDLYNYLLVLFRWTTDYPQGYCL